MPIVMDMVIYTGRKSVLWVLLNQEHAAKGMEKRRDGPSDYFSMSQRVNEKPCQSLYQSRDREGADFVAERGPLPHSRGSEQNATS